MEMKDKVKKVYFKIEKIKHKEFMLFTDSVLNPTTDYDFKLKSIKKKLKKNKIKLNTLIQQL